MAIFIDYIFIYFGYYNLLVLVLWIRILLINYYKENEEFTDETLK